jgi:hypothetical protein
VIFLATLTLPKQPPGLVLGEHRRLAALDDALRSAHRMRRVDREHLVDDEPVEQHVDRGEVVLDGRPSRCTFSQSRIAGGRDLERFDIRRDMEGLDIDERADAVPLDPGEERAHGPVIRHARVVVFDRRGEKFEEAA